MGRYKSTGFIQWEFETDETHEKAIKRAEALFHEIIAPPVELEKYKNLSFHVDIQPMKDRVQPVKLREYDFKKIIPFITEDETYKSFKVNKKIYEVKMNSQRYHVFRKESCCVSCGLEGTRLFLETNNVDDNQAYFNFYCEDDGELVVMTKDHITPKAYGGLDVLDNLQTMCYVCNQLKASYSLDLEGIRILREVQRKNTHLSRKELNKVIQSHRLMLLNCLNGQ